MSTLKEHVPLARSQKRKKKQAQKVLKRHDQQFIYVETWMERFLEEEKAALSLIIALFRQRFHWNAAILTFSMMGEEKRLQMHSLEGLDPETDSTCKRTFSTK